MEFLKRFTKNGRTVSSQYELDRINIPDEFRKELIEKGFAKESGKKVKEEKAAKPSKQTKKMEIESDK